MKNSKEYHALRREKFLSRGLCPRDGRPRDDPNKIWCAHCREVHRKNNHWPNKNKQAKLYQRRVRAEWRRKGLCSHDGKEIEIDEVEAATNPKYKKPKQCLDCRRRSRNHHRLYDMETIEKGVKISIRGKKKGLQKHPYPEGGKCVLCGRNLILIKGAPEPLRLHYHHWNSEYRYELAMWICFRCHHVATLEEECGKGAAAKAAEDYWALKEKIESNFFTATTGRAARPNPA